MSKRSATTLMEVLIAIFVMGIGLMAVMSLFPFGALRMASAIEDDRVGHCAANAMALAIAKNIRFDPNVTRLFDEPEHDQVGSNAGYTKAPPEGPSYPIFVDPFGYQSYTAGFSQDWMAGDRFRGIRRAKLSFTMTTQTTLKWCALLDDIQFGSDGPPTIESGEIQRTIIYTWAWMLRRPKAGVPSVCELTVLVYKKRPLVVGLPVGSKEVSYRNCGYDAQQPNLVTMKWTAAMPAPRLSPGDWVLDSTPTPNPNSAQGVGILLPPTAEFYRVVQVGDAGINTLDIELDRPIKGPFPRPGFSGPQIVVLDGLVGVFPCGPGWSVGQN